MSKYAEILDAVKNAESIKEKTQMSEYFLNVIERVKDDLYADERADITDFALEELETIPELIKNAESYREKCKIFDYENAVLGLVTVATGYVGELPQEKLDMVKSVVELINSETFLENAVDALFEKEEITLYDAEELVSLVSGLTDTYQKARFYQGMLEYAELVENMSDEAWKRISDYISSELDAFFERGNSLTNDDIVALELACDACKLFFNDAMAEKVVKILSLGYSNVNYYAIATLLESKYQIPEEAVTAIAKDLEYACNAYSLFEKYGKTDLFPKECSDPVYLAKSDMAHWLSYPTELGKMPDEIEYLGQAKVKKEMFFIFRYKSDSENLSEELKGEWLIGWSSNDGGTFSNFDLYEDYEKKTVEKTVKYIKRKLIG